MVTLSVSTECACGLHDKCPKFTIAKGGGIGDGWSCFCECHAQKPKPGSHEPTLTADDALRKKADP